MINRKIFLKNNQKSSVFCKNVVYYGQTLSGADEKYYVQDIMLTEVCFRWQIVCRRLMIRDKNTEFLHGAVKMG